MMLTIRTLFDEIAPTYDLLNHLFSLSIDRWWRYKAIRSIQMPSQARVIDVCTGTADIALAVAKRYPTSSIYAIDVSSRMLKYGQKKSLRLNMRQNVQFLNADAFCLPFQDDSCNVAFLSFGLRNLSDRLHGLQEIRRVLEPGGQLVIVEFALPPKNLFRSFFHIYVGRVMPVIGGIISKSPAAYRYLHGSIEKFPEPTVISALLRQAGFLNVRWQSMTWGMVSVFYAQENTTT